MQIKFVGLLVISLLVGFSPAYAAATSTSTSAIESHDQRLPSQQANIDTSTSQPPATTVGVIQKTPAQDCDGEAPSTGSVVALLNRLVRSSAVAQGKYCSPPPVPEKHNI